MVTFSPPHLQQELEQRVLARTGRRVRNLAIELSSERIVLRGRADTYYVKQLVQHSVLRVCARGALANEIEVL